jgi:hypothetical protein
MWVYAQHIHPAGNAGHTAISMRRSKRERKGGRSGMRERNVVMGMKQNGMKQKPAKLTSISAFSAPPREPILLSP